MRFDYQRRLAASILGVGINRVWITTDPKVQDDILDAITRDGIRNLIRRHIIQKRPERGVSRGRARHRAAQKAKGRRRGHGSREGALNARTPQKRRWIGVIRGMRRHLRELRDQGRIDVHTYRRFYAQAKGGMFKSRAHLDQQLRAAGAVREAAK
jgi:large subunit ribosomal protein L19e